MQFHFQTPTIVYIGRLIIAYDMDLVVNIICYSYLFHLSIYVLTYLID